MKIRSIVFYYSKRKAKGSQMVSAYDPKTGIISWSYIRTEMVNKDAVHALDSAAPLPHEIVLNAVEIS